MRDNLNTWLKDVTLMKTRREPSELETRYNRVVWEL